ncbi:MAG TPA: hypothetical protein VF133_18055 [Terriglobales bacterium]
MSNQNRDSETVISAAFGDLFTAGSAIEALTQAGFGENDVELVGVLHGQLPNLSRLCNHMGMPAEHASYYQACFEDGGVLLVVRAYQRSRSHTALAVLRQCGGVLPPTIQ